MSDKKACKLIQCIRPTEDGIKKVEFCSGLYLNTSMSVKYKTQQSEKMLSFESGVLIRISSMRAFKCPL